MQPDSFFRKIKYFYIQSFLSTNPSFRTRISFLSSLSRFLSLVLFLFSFEILGDTVILKNKKVYKGKVLTQNEYTLVLKSKEGQELSFLKRNVLKVVYKDLNEVEVKKVIQEEEKKIVEIPTKKTEEEPQAKEEHIEEPVETSPDFEKRHWLQITWRSALVPGWGQYKADRKWTAGFTFLSSLLALNYVGAGAANYSSAESNYKKQSLFTPAFFINATPEDSGGRILFAFAYNANIYSKFQAQTMEANSRLTALGLFYGLQLLHAIYIGKQWEKEPIQTVHGNYFLPGWNINLDTHFDRHNNQRMGQIDIYYNFAF